jgi:hypothetical protein
MDVHPELSAIDNFSRECASGHSIRSREPYRWSLLAPLINHDLHLDCPFSCRSQELLDQIALALKSSL